ncbi:MAG: peptide-methionine (S)-S-oxide reductase MsrA [Bacteroidales bacterium]|nr:peptide-methionine (S)-S-oxide reductase MsrA [Bacteroidales bacterium]
MCAEVYFAGGCFWGVEHFFKGVDGVLGTEPGYANGSIANPTYEQVYTDTTGFAETVRVQYDPSRVSLARLVRLFFTVIDPLSLNRQGHDEGTRYRTGVYYSAVEDLPVIEAEFALLRERIGAEPVVELEPLRCFYGAEERHKDYLDKNAGGYCHLPLKVFRYLRLYQDIRLMIEGETDGVARMAEAAALIFERMRFFWVGFYRVIGDELVLGPFQGPAACLRIARGRGVCGTAWRDARTIVVPDVEQFPGHIACSSQSRSEIVVPLLRDGSVTAVLDIDSTELSEFDASDAIWLELICETI